MQALALTNIKERLARFIASRLPLSRRTIYTPLWGEQPISTVNIDAATVHSILDGTDFGNTNEYFALCDLIILSDSHIQGEIAKRKLAILGDPFVVAPVDKKNTDDVKAAATVKEMVDGLTSFLPACAALLDGTIWPLAIVEKVFRPSANPKLSYEVDRLIRVPPRLFDYTQTGSLRIWDTDPNTGMVLGTHHDPDPMRYITHRGHLLTTPDYRGGPMRSLIFWWLFSNYDRDWWARFLDRYGSPFLVGKYDQADDDSRIILQNAFSLATKIGGLVISRQTEVEIKEALSKSGGEGFDLFLKICQREKSKLIVGQTTSADAEHGGLGSTGVAKEQANVRGDIRQFDSIWLGNTLRHNLFDPFLRMNGLPGSATIIWGAEEADDIAQLSDAVASLSNAGIEVTDEGLETLAAKVGLPLQRKEIVDQSQGLNGLPAGPRRSMKALSAPGHLARFEQADLANATIARTTSARLARAFSGAFAPVGKMVADSSSPEELIQKIDTFYAGWSPGVVSEIILEALAAQAANGAVRDAA